LVRLSTFNFQLSTFDFSRNSRKSNGYKKHGGWGMIFVRFFPLNSHLCSISRFLGDESWLFLPFAHRRRSEERFLHAQANHPAGAGWEEKVGLLRSK
jgi:hypothetical protein